jgi:hypothetical protein
VEIREGEQLLDEGVVPGALPEGGGVGRCPARQVDDGEGADRTDGWLGVGHGADAEVVGLRHRGQGFADRSRGCRGSGAPAEVGDRNGHGGGHVVRLAFAFPGRHEGVG